jgi:hypothetical protein
MYTFLYRIDKFLSLQFVATYLAGRDDLIEKAAPYLAKAFVTFKVSLNSRGALDKRHRW